MADNQVEKGNIPSLKLQTSDDIIIDICGIVKKHDAHTAIVEVKE